MKTCPVRAELLHNQSGGGSC